MNELQVSSTAFRHQEKIPLRYSGDGENVSPPLSWGPPPEGAVEIALICDDPDAPTDQPWVHWVIYGLPASARGLPEAISPKPELDQPVKALQGKNSWGKVGYGGPAPPRGHGTHHYHFTVYALSKPASLKSGAEKHQLLKAMEGNVVAKGTLTGTYQR